MRLATLGFASAALLAVFLPLFAETPSSSRIERRLKKALEDGQQSAGSGLAADLDAALRPGSTLAAIRKAITFDACRSDIYFLASDELEGRDTGSVGHRKAAQWAADRFAEAGLKAVGDDETYFQAWKWGKKPTLNVVAYIEGKTDELVVVGAHLDHVGKGPAGGMSARIPHPLAGSDETYNGADDNASGSTTVVEMACALAKLQAKPQRGILFILFSGEEKGLFGSAYYAAHPIFPLKKTIAMLNYDMVGRNADHECDVLGQDGSPELGDAVRRVNASFGMNLHMPPKSPGIYAQSDQWSFQPKGVPSIFFTSGMHTEYHTALDSADLINVGKLEEVAELGAALALEVANLENRPSWHKIDLGPRLGVGVGPISAKKRKELGVGEDEGAVILTQVTPDFPAARAGLLAGDVIVAIDGKKIPAEGSDEAFREMIYDSEKQVFTVIRGGKRIKVTVDYAAPKKDPKPPKKK
ncbi:MAG: M28 family peptidase [Planctomycetes bacterium]|nr:M28 family peptidase [Planctomycetota bacterium]